MTHRIWRLARLTAAAAALITLGAVLFGMSAVARPSTAPATRQAAGRGGRSNAKLYAQGRKVFRNDTFGDQAFWGGGSSCTRRSRAQAGGVGPGVEPEDGARGRPQGRRHGAAGSAASRRSRQGKVNLDKPETTLALLKLNAVVGVKGFFNRREHFVGRHDVRGLPLDRERLGRAGHRQAPGRLGQPRPQRRRNRQSRWRRTLGGRNMLGVDEATVGRCWRAGVQGSSTPSCSSTARPSGPTEHGRGAHPAGVRPRRREPAHVDGLGLDHLLERVRRQPRDARKRQVHDPRLDNTEQFPIAAKNGFGNVDQARI